MSNLLSTQAMPWPGPGPHIRGRDYSRYYGSYYGSDPGPLGEVPSFRIVTDEQRDEVHSLITSVQRALNELEGDLRSVDENLASDTADQIEALGSVHELMRQFAAPTPMVTWGYHG